MSRRDRLSRAALPATAVGLFVLFTAWAIWSAVQANTLGYDYRAYDAAVRRLFGGGALYDMSVQAFGGPGIFFYPPPFVLVAAPLTILPTEAAAWAMTVLIVLSFLVTVWILPVSRQVRWATLLLGAISWPLLYSIRLGQVGPFLLLLFAIGWRWMDQPRRLGSAIALGTAIKIQPILLLGWALVTGRRRAVVVAIGVFAALAVAATLIVGPGAWRDQAELVARVSRPIETPHSFAPGRLAFEAGLGETTAWAIEITNWVLCGAIMLFAWRYATPVSAYLATVVATQLLSPVLWDHYALMVLLPVAWLLEQRRWWILVVPLAISLPGTAFLPSAVYPAALWVALLSVVAVGIRPPASLVGSVPVEA